MLAGRRILIVLDNARDVEHVRPLLPGGPGCLVVVTSRSQLAGLVAAEGARTLTLDLMATEEAHDLLANRLGAGRVRAEPDAAAEIITSCARLPLALSIVAARAATHPDFPLAALASELHEARGGLDALTGGDPASDVRAVFSCSYRILSTAAARLFRLLGLPTGPDLGAPAAASLAGIPAARVRPLLAELARAHLLTEHTPARYILHDLLRTYATEEANAHDTETDRRQAVRRLLDHYLHTAHTANQLLDPNQGGGLTLAPARTGVTPEGLRNDDQAMDWFAAEHPVLLAAIEQAAQIESETNAWQLAWAFREYLNRRGQWHDILTTEHTALRAARRQADRPGQALAHRGLGIAYAMLGRYDDATIHLRHALDLYGGLDDHTSHAHTHRNLAVVAGKQGRPSEALNHVEHALDLYRAAGNRAGQARAHAAIGWWHALLGNSEQTLAYCERALSVHQELGDRLGEAGTWHTLGYAHHHLGHHEQATACCRHALALSRYIGNRYIEAEALHLIGDSHHAADNPVAAREAWQQALTILDELDHSDADQVRAKLDRIGQAGQPNSTIRRA